MFTEAEKIAALMSLWTNLSHTQLQERFRELSPERNCIKSITYLTFFAGEGGADVQANCAIVEAKSGKIQGVVAQQSTRSDADWQANLDWALQPMTEATHMPQNCRVHRGFYNQTTAMLPQINAWLKARRSQITAGVIMTGFSQGGALALVSIPLLDYQRMMVSGIVFAAPRIGNPALYTQIETYANTLKNQQVDMDPVPRLPPRRTCRNQGQVTETLRISRQNDAIRRGFNDTICAWCQMCGRDLWADHDMDYIIDRIVAGGSL